MTTSPALRAPAARLQEPREPVSAVGGGARSTATTPSVVDSDFARELLAGLSRQPRSIAPKFFYDTHGSSLFEQICEQPEYYPTRTELQLLADSADDIAACIGDGADIIEFGAGATQKIRLLLDANPRTRRFVPIDISGEHLVRAAKRLERDYPQLLVQPVVADFTRPVALPAWPQPGALPARRIGFFPGSSIGNFTPDEALRFLRQTADLLHGGSLLVGVDLVKDPAVLHAAYNDAEGITAAFNLNVLTRANRELGADFDLAQFRHYAFYQPALQRVEMHLVSMRDQAVRVCGHDFAFAEGQTLHTENSHKFTVAGFQALALRAGFRPRKVWCDAERRFSLHWLDAPAGSVGGVQ